MNLRIISLLALISCISCKKQLLPIGNSDLASVEADLRPYFVSFINEGAERGVAVDIEEAGISAVIDNIHEGNVVGTCSWGYVDGKEIVIDRSFWNESNDNWREYVVYHELGHCFLERDHLDASYPNGTCVSIMYSGTGGCSEVYGTSNREDYLDELFSIRGGLAKN